MKIVRRSLFGYSLFESEPQQQWVQETRYRAPEDFGMVEPSEPEDAKEQVRDEKVDSMGVQINDTAYIEFLKMEAENKVLKAAFADKQKRFDDLVAAFDCLTPYMNYIANWERHNGTLAAIMPHEYENFILGIRSAAITASARAAQVYTERATK